MTRPVVLVTGLSGLIGRAFLEHEGGAFEVRGLNRRSVPGVVCHQADVTDLEAVAPAFAGVDTVVHLAAVVGSDVPFATLLRDNIQGPTTSSKPPDALASGASYSRAAATR